MQPHSGLGAADSQHGGSKRGPGEPPSLQASPRATRQRVAQDAGPVTKVTRCRFAVRRVGEPAIYAPETPREAPELRPSDPGRSAPTHVSMYGLASGEGTVDPLRLSVPTPSLPAPVREAVPSDYQNPSREAARERVYGMPSVSFPGLREPFPQTRQLTGEVNCAPGPAPPPVTTASGTQTNLTLDDLRNLNSARGANSARGVQPPRSFAAFSREPNMQNLQINDSISHISDVPLSSDRSQSAVTPSVLPAGLRQDFLPQSPEVPYEDTRDASARSMTSGSEALQPLTLPEAIFARNSAEGVWATDGAKDRTHEARSDSVIPTPARSTRGAREFGQQFPTPSHPTIEALPPASDMSVDADSRAASAPGETSLESVAQLLPLDQSQSSSTRRKTKQKARRQNSQHGQSPAEQVPLVYPRYTRSLPAPEVPSEGYPKTYASRLVEGLRDRIKEGQEALLEDWGLSDASSRIGLEEDDPDQIKHVVASLCDKISRRAYRAAVKAYGTSGASASDAVSSSNHLDENAADEEAHLAMLRNQDEQLDRQLHELRQQKLGDLASQLESCGGRHIMDDITTPIDSDQLIDVMDDADAWLMQNLEQLEQEAKDLEMRERACAERDARLSPGAFGLGSNGNFLRGLAPSANSLKSSGSANGAFLRDLGARASA